MKSPFPRKQQFDSGVLKRATAKDLCKIRKARQISKTTIKEAGLLETPIATEPVKSHGLFRAAEKKASFDYDTQEFAGRMG